MRARNMSVPLIACPLLSLMTHANAWSDLGILETTAMLYASAFLMAFNSATGLETVHQFSEF